MARFDRYMLSQLMVLFGFFSLVLVSVYWVNRAVVLFDRLIADGQSAGVFLEFTALSLPNVIRMVLPMAAFAATVYVTNRLSSESELTVMQATGFSPWRLARPVLIFGLIVGAMMAALTHFLVPASLDRFEQREAEIAESVTARLLREGTFLNPTRGVTFYIRDITPEGELQDVFLSDRRTEGRDVTYSAQTAYLIRDDSGPKLVMIDGLAQTYVQAEQRLSTTVFSDFSYDVGDMIGSDAGVNPNVRHMGTGALMGPRAEVAAYANTSEGRVMEELHGRFNQPILCVVASLIGFATLLAGGFSRFGVGRQIIGAIFLLVIVQLVQGAVTDPLRGNAALWPLVYLPSAVGLAMALAILGWAARPVGLRRGRKGPDRDDGQDRDGGEVPA